MRTCDANGRLDPNGEFEITPRRKTLKDGDRLTFEVSLMDAGPATEQTVADAYAEMVADLTGPGIHRPASPATAAEAGAAYRDMLADMALSSSR